MITPIRKISGRAIPLDRADVDTDQIMPAIHLLRIERTGFGAFAFELWRKDPGFVLNDPRYKGAPIMIASRNFGCGSSREHAVWGIHDLGIKCIIAPSFADIFRANALNVGILTIELPAERCDMLSSRQKADPESEISIDLDKQTIACPKEKIEFSFEISPLSKRCLMEGLDSIDVTLEALNQIVEYERNRPVYMPDTGKYHRST